jgi:DNA-binding MarR family transcriptional regulator/GNAT superfamily N-acetyltransferase
MTVSAERVATLRRFDRFYTDAVGALRSGLLDSPYNLTEARVLYELAHRGTSTAGDLRRDLDVDAGYLSRILRRFAADGLVSSEVSVADGRRREVRLTAQGRRAFGELNRLSDRRAHRFLGALGEADQQRLLTAMETIENVLRGRSRADLVVLRPPRPGDFGWVIQANAETYAEEFGWDASYEVLVSRIVSDYANGHDPAREASWIAEVDGARVGCVFCVRYDDETAQLRLLLVDPSARGLGIGGRLVDECLRFARRAGYRRIRLWTNSVLADARRIYERAGFTLTSSDEHHSFGHDLVGQIWERDLSHPPIKGQLSRSEINSRDRRAESGP